MSRWKITAPLATLGLAISLAAAMPQGPSAGETATPAAASAAAVRIDNFNFTPPALVVAPGTTVSWTNDDDTPHTNPAPRCCLQSEGVAAGKEHPSSPGEACPWQGQCPSTATR